MTTQISKIQLRRGVQSDLTSTNELDIGEVAFTTDTNRLFVGSDPITSNTVSTVHTAQNLGGFPFTNVEILTEFSPVNQALFDSSARQINTAFFVSTQMSVTSNTINWQPLLIQKFSASGGLIGTVPFVINTASSNLIGSAKISYYLVDSATNVALRTGQLTIFDQLGSPFSIAVKDEATANPYAISNDPNMRYGMIQFKATVSGGNIGLLYQINIAPGAIPVMYFRIEQPNFMP